MIWRVFFIVLFVFPSMTNSQGIVWENQAFYDEQGLPDSIAFSDPGRFVKVMLTWDTVVDVNQSILKHITLYGENFISYEEDMQGGEMGHLTPGFDNSMADSSDYLQLELTFDQPVINLKFNILDVDQGPDLSGLGSYCDDAVEVFYNENIPALDSAFYTIGPCVSKSDESGILGFDGDSLCMGVLEFDSTANIKFHFGDTLVSKIIIKYSLTIQSQSDPNSQQIGLGDLFFQPTSPALPVELTSFEVEGNIDKLNLELIWQTATEINSEYFEVEHAIDRFSFRPIGRLNSVGHSNTLTEYRFLHEEVNFDHNYYRLKSVDQDGSFDYSPIRHVSFKLLKNNYRIFPNPVSSVFKISENPGEGKLVLYDVSGRQVYQSNLREKIFKISHLARGIYLMDISSSPENHQQRIMKQ